MYILIFNIFGLNQISKHEDEKLRVCGKCSVPYKGIITVSVNLSTLIPCKDGNAQFIALPLITTLLIKIMIQYIIV